MGCNLVTGEGCSAEGCLTHKKSIGLGFVRDRRSFLLFPPREVRGRYRRWACAKLNFSGLRGWRLRCALAAGRRRAMNPFEPTRAYNLKRPSVHCAARPAGRGGNRAELCGGASVHRGPPAAGDCMLFACHVRSANRQEQGRRDRATSSARAEGERVCRVQKVAVITGPANTLSRDSRSSRSQLISHAPPDGGRHARPIGIS